jgi:hypothetical protein
MVKKLTTVSTLESIIKRKLPDIPRDLKFSAIDVSGSFVMRGGNKLGKQV